MIQEARFLAMYGAFSSRAAAFWYMLTTDGGIWERPQAGTGCCAIAGCGSDPRLRQAIFVIRMFRPTLQHWPITVAKS
jgi:hypothetical protein